MIVIDQRQYRAFLIDSVRSDPLTPGPIPPIRSSRRVGIRSSLRRSPGPRVHARLYDAALLGNTDSDERRDDDMIVVLALTASSPQRWHEVQEP